MATARDGQSLATQDASTQAMFQAVHGANADNQWAAEHNAAIGAPAPAPAAAPSAGGGGGPAPKPGVQQQAQQSYGGVSQDDLNKLSAGFAASSGMSVKQLNEQIRQFDATLDWQKKMWEQQGLPQLAIQQRAADLEERKFGELTTQATRQQSWVEEIGRRQAALSEKAQADQNAIAQGQLSLGQNQLGLDTLKTAASLSGPADWIKAANFSRGVAGDAALPGFIRNLLSGQSNAVLGGATPGASMSTAQSMANMAQRMGATGPALPTTPQVGSVDPAVAGLRAVLAQGGQALGPQQLEGMTATERAMFEGGGADVGGDMPGFFDAYKRSRIGQSAALPG